jgi:hypothetical protein
MAVDQELAKINRVLDYSHANFAIGGMLLVRSHVGRF